MKKLNKILHNRHYIMFLDFEGTQRTAEMIALGAILVSLNKDGTIKKEREPFKVYVKASSKVGPYVVKLTGITDELLAKEAVSFKEAMNRLKKYAGLAWKKCMFMTFGTNDMRILNSSISHNIGSPMDLCHQIHINYFDFAGFMDDYIRDDKGNSLSLLDYLELFKIPLQGEPHDPAVDAIHLEKVYDAFIKQANVVETEYVKQIFRQQKYPEPVKRLLSRISKGEQVNIETLKEEVRRDLQ